MTATDRRGTDRRPQPIDIEYWCDGTRHQGRIQDLSEGGLYVYTGLSWPARKAIEFRFLLPDGSQAPIEGHGTVVWWEPMGFGVRFDRLAAGDRERLRRFVDELPESLPTPARGSRWL